MGTRWSFRADLGSMKDTMKQTSWMISLFFSSSLDSSLWGEKRRREEALTFSFLGHLVNMWQRDSSTVNECWMFSDCFPSCKPRTVHYPRKKLNKMHIRPQKCEALFDLPHVWKQTKQGCLKGRGKHLVGSVVTNLGRGPFVTSQTGRNLMKQNMKVGLFSFMGVCWLKNHL